MYAIVEIAGKQFKAVENAKLYVPRLQADVDSTLTLGQVLLVAGNGDVHVGAPVVSGATVSARVMRHLKGDKMLVFKKKRRKRYRLKKGHRQQYTQLEIGAVSLGNETENADSAA